MNLPNRKSQKGFTIIELLIVLAVALALIGLAASYGPTLFGGQRSAAGNLALQAIVQGGNAVKSGPTFVGVDQTAIARSGKLPTTMVGPGNTIINQWNGTVTVAPVTWNGTANGAMAVTYPGVPRNECNSIISSAGSNFVKIVVGASPAVKDDSAGTALTTGAVTAACDNASNSIVFTTTG